MRRSLLLWSGGLDSTYSLVRLLRTTKDQVFTHHVQCRGVDAWRGEYERRAIDRLRSVLRNCDRSFVHTRCCLDLLELSGRGIDISLLAFMAGQAAMSHGLTPFDRILVGVNGDRDPGWDPDSAACALRRRRIAGALRAAWGCDEVPQVYFWLPRPSQAEMLSTLGKELRALTVSCLRPSPGPLTAGHGAGATQTVTTNNSRTLHACGECAKCGRAKRMDSDLSGCVDSRDDDGTGGEISGDAATDAATRTPPLFHHLSQLSNKMQEPHRAAAASDPLAP
jgi:7-cyano-7-deazaguanine synthase in queuosine biosynthesis